MKNYLTLNRIKLVREKDVEYDAPHIITCPEDAVEVANAIFDMENLAEETMIALLLDMKNHVIGAHELSHHPSGNPAPSVDDIKTTEIFMKLGRLMGIEVFDHIVIGYQTYISIKEKLAK